MIKIWRGKTHCHLNRVRYLDFGFCHRNKQVDFATRVRDALSIFLYSVRSYGICPVECKPEEMWRQKTRHCLRALNISNPSVILNFLLVNIQIKNCFKMINRYFNDNLFFNLLLSVSNLGVAPLEATALYVEESVVSIWGGIERYDSWQSF